MREVPAVRSTTPGGYLAWPVLATAAAEELVLPAVQGVHRAVSAATFRWFGPPGRPVQRVVDRVADSAYAGVGQLLRGIGTGLRRACSYREATTRRAPMPDVVPRARAVAAGIADGRFHARVGLPAAPMTVHLVGGQDPVAPEVAAAALPAPTSQVVVLVHGLTQTEQMWRARVAASGLPAVASASGAAVLLVRYDTGRAVEQNAAELSERLEEIRAAWPGGLRRLVLVGYSMGGLVIGGAARRAEAQGLAWPEVVSDVVHLATPHLGSWLEKTANVTGWTLRHASPITAPLGELLDRRSQGIKDLRFGTVGQQPSAAHVDGLFAGWGGAPAWVPPARHHLVTGRLHPRRHHPVNLAVGDALVRRGSARGVGLLRRIPVATQARCVEVHAGHLALARHPEVADLLRRVLADAAGTGNGSVWTAVDGAAPAFAVPASHAHTALS